MKATLTAYYNRDPKMLVVDKPAGDWMKLDAFLMSLGFLPAIKNWQPVPGRYDFKTGSSSELDKVIGIVREGGDYLTSGNFEYAFQM